MPQQNLFLTCELVDNKISCGGFNLLGGGIKGKDISLVRQLNGIAMGASRQQYIHPLFLNENDYIKKLEDTLQEQIKLKTTYFGVHRAEYQFYYKDSLSRKFSSQGEKRMFALIMKLASEKIFLEYRNKKPILLIDDAMLELDNIKRDSILEYIKTLGQVFITVTEKEKVKNFESGKIFDIANY